MKTFKEFKTELDENAGLIARTVAKAGSKVLAKQKAERDEKQAQQDAKEEEKDGGNSLGMDMKPKKPSSLSNQRPAVKEEKEANAENCSDLPPEEKKKERKLDIRKIRAKR